MRAAALDTFLAEQIARAKADDVLFSVHLKATMMKVSDPIIFGHVVRAFLPEVFATVRRRPRRRRPVRANNGLGSILDGLGALGDKGAEIKAAIDQGLADGPRLAMVNSDKGITNLHVPSDVIVDASMPAMIRTSGHMWGPDGAEADTLAVIPDSSYAGIYQAVIDDCRAHGAYDPTTMGSVPNVGLMAQKAEEYGSHDKTFEIAEAGTVQVVNAAGDVLMEHDVAARRHLAGLPDQGRADPRLGQARRHPGPRLQDARRLLARRVPRPRPQPHREGQHLPRRTTTPTASTSRSSPRSRRPRFSVERIRKGEDTISVTGNVLRDYNTDLFPILELGTSAKMLSVVPLMNGGGLFETGAGGSAPKHVQQLVQENYLRWDSLGEFLALAESLRHMATTTDNARAELLAEALDRATERLLNENKGPARKVGQIDNRGSHFYLALFWAHELATQTAGRRARRLVRAGRRDPRRPTRRRSTTSCSASRATRPTSAATTALTRPRPQR